MIQIRSKQAQAAIVPAALIGAAAVLAVVNSERYLPRVLVGCAALLSLLWLILWAGTRTTAAQRRAAAAEQRARSAANCAAAARRAARSARRRAAASEAALNDLQTRVARAAEVKRQLDELELRLCAVETDAVGRNLAKRLWSDHDWESLFDATKDEDGKTPN